MPLQRSTGPATSGPAPAPPGPVRRPLTGSRPSLAAARVQRAHDGAPADAPPAAAGAEAESPGIGPVAIQGLTAAGAWGNTATHLSGDGVGRLPSVAASASSFGAVAPGLQRIPASPPRQTARPALARPAVAAPSSPLVAHPAQPAQPALGIVAGPPAGPAVQALPQSAPLVAPVATAVVQRIDGAAPAAPVESEGQSEGDLDDLARKLFGRFQNRLRAELIYEREAKGLTFDN
ncbi:MAG TPA: hypothetical protein VK871_02105 [Candidatus Limnocylindrales bacterium]|nr:hypothetical protein [Candidatus Limnocylindrales bacterium]